jgi:tRNA(fMet)-specific endonuclease VapC
LKHLLDTCVLSLLGRGGSARLDARLRSEARNAIGISSVTVFEVRYGLELAPAELKSRRLVESFLSIVGIVDFDAECAAAAGALRAKLKRKGEMIGPYDLLIAGTALAKGLILVTQNGEEFRRIGGLRVEDWTKS